ncbi:outer membrane protein [Helicobacter suis]|uniref:outer membrane protein n=1 Tax=Helicobacter suis TaxID=104628 RepID=UPI0013D15BFC|nr:outer membrane protein [Helicobacter suis]
MVSFNKQQATSNKQQTRGVFSLVFARFITLAGTLSFISLAPLSAEGNGAFVEGGFQYSNFSGADKSFTGASSYSYSGQKTYSYPASSGTNKYSGNLFGADIQIGYKQFFGAKKRFGLRYYGFFSGQGGSANVYVPAVNSSDTGVAYDYNQPSANLFYGAGVDALYNFYERGDKTFGIALGVMIGGSSWLMGKAYDQGCQWATYDAQENPTGCVTMNNHFAQQAKQPGMNSGGTKTSFSPSYVQFIFNVGFRANLSKHQGFEVGVRIPTIDDPYYTTSSPAITNSHYGTTYTQSSHKQTITFRRNIAAYLNYVINF